MPFYQFILETIAKPAVITERLRSLVRETPQAAEFSFRSFWKSSEESGPPFVGCVDGHAFQLRRVIRGRNSFLPRIWGHIISTGDGTRVKVIMFMHPFTVVFVLFWLGAVGYGAWDAFAHSRIRALRARLIHLYSSGCFYSESLWLQEVFSLKRQRRGVCCPRLFSSQMSICRNRNPLADSY
jgi:hypothetical protein